jgi:acyl carrier protein
MNREEITQIILDELEVLADKTVTDLDADIFFKRQFLDSMNILNLVVYIEQRFEIKLEPFFLDREAVSSVNKIVDYVEQRISANADS